MSIQYIFFNLHTYNVSLYIFSWDLPPSLRSPVKPPPSPTLTHTPSQLILSEALLTIVYVYRTYPTFSPNSNLVPSFIMAQKHPTSTSSQPAHHNFATLSQSIETILNNIFVMLFIGFSIKCYPLNFVSQALDIPKHVFTPNQSNLLSFYTRRSRYLTIKKF